MTTMIVMVVCMMHMITVMILVVMIMGLIIRLNRSLRANPDLWINGTDFTNLTSRASLLTLSTVTERKRDVFCLSFTITDLLAHLWIRNAVMRITALLYEVKLRVAQHRVTMSVAELEAQTAETS